MKKFIPVLVIVLVLLVCLCACSKKDEPTVIKQSDTYIVLTPTKDFAGKNLIDFMAKAKSDGDLEYEVANGMVTSINGIANPSDFSSCWMLYTSDEAQANTAWGTIEYNGKTYGSATKGAEELVVIEGGLYIWVFTTF